VTRYNAGRQEAPNQENLGEYMVQVAFRSRASDDEDGSMATTLPYLFGFRFLGCCYIVVCPDSKFWQTDCCRLSLDISSRVAKHSTTGSDDEDSADGNKAAKNASK
jgi:hypothetical protein